ncbi:MAG: hypothetical protein L0216_19415 [Planctomycetales bacterium]|nr:hypothetical protein [Planctomycetales bacterium]
MRNLLQALVDAIAGRPIRFHPPRAGRSAAPEPTLPSGVPLREFRASLARSFRDVDALQRRLGRIALPPGERLPCLCAFLDGGRPSGGPRQPRVLALRGAWPDALERMRAG